MGCAYHHGDVPLKLAELFPNCVTEVETEESNREPHERHEQGETDHFRDATKMVDEKVLFPEESYAIQGAIFDVYHEMGCGFLECLEKEFRWRQLPFEEQKDLVLSYKGEQLVQTYKPDFICYSKIIVELKAVKEIAPEHKAQMLNYLKATGLELGLLVNFGAYPKAEIVRIANTNFRDFRVFRG